MLKTKFLQYVFKLSLSPYDFPSCFKVFSLIRFADPESSAVLVMFARHVTRAREHHQLIHRN